MKRDDHNLFSTLEQRYNMDLFYALPADCSTGAVILRGDEFHHCVHVMRRRVGDTLMITDGVGNLYNTTIARIESSCVEAQIVGIQKNVNEPSLRVTLAIGMLKNPSRIEFAIEKCTELGVAAFIPLQTSRAIPHSVKINRWHNIVLAAMKQSCRTILPSILSLQDFDKVLAGAAHFDIKLIAHEAGEISATIPTVMNDNQGSTSAIICIGPEGGFTEEEVREADDAGFTAVSLGRRRLRGETAAVSAASLLLSSLQ